MLKIISALLALLLVGCAQSSGHFETVAPSDKADVTFIGVPTALGLGLL